MIELERPVETIPCVLKRGDLDERDRAICAAVWSHYDQTGCGMSLRRLSRVTGIPLTPVIYRISGRCGPARSLNERGWLQQPRVAAPFQKGVHSGTITPGPRFAALESSQGVKYPLEWSS